MNKKIEELKNNLIEKNIKLQKITDELNEYKNRKNSIDEAKKSSQFVMEIASLKRINSSLNKQINELKKKNNKGNNNNVNNKEGELKYNIKINKKNI